MAEATPNEALVEGRADLVGRDDELAQIRSMVTDVAAGRGRSVWIDGEPGVGKSALVAAVLAEVEQSGCQVFTASAYEAGSSVPLRPLLEAFGVRPGSTEKGRADISELLWGTETGRRDTFGDPAVAAAELLLALIDRLCTTGPAVLAIDDLQWADQLSLAVWGRLHRTIGQLPLLLIAAARPVPIREEVDRLRETMIPEPVRLRLEPLSRAHVTVLLHRWTSATPGSRLLSLVEQAGGNPLYVRELVDTLAREHRIAVRGGVGEVIGESVMPASLSSAISARLKHLSAPCRRALRMATLLGPEFQVHDLSVVTGLGATRLVNVVEEGQVAGVIAASGGSLVFRHGLIRHALYEGMSPRLRAALHHRAARALAASGALAELVAEQLLATPDVSDEWTLDWLILAAPTLNSRAPSLAEGLLRRVREVTRPTDRRRSTLELHLVTALFQLSRYDEVEAFARPHLDHDSNPEACGRMAWFLAQAFALLLRFEEALEICGKTLMERKLRPLWTARLRAMHAMIMTVCGRFEEGQAIAEQATTEALIAGDLRAAGYAMAAQSMVEHFHRRDERAALATGERALAIVAQAPDAIQLRLVLVEARIEALRNLGQAAECQRAVGVALALAEQSGSPGRLAILRVRAGEANFYNGRWDDALAELAVVGELPLDAARELVFRGVRALIAIHRDDREQLATWLQHHEEEVAAADAWYLLLPLLIARAFAEREDQPRMALELLLNAIDPGATGTFPELTPERCWWLPDLVQLALDQGERTVAGAAVRAITIEASRNPLPVIQASEMHCRGLLDGDVNTLLAAAEAYDHTGAPLWSAHALEGAALLLAKGGDTRAARAEYTKAARIYAGLGATWDLRLADAQLRPLGIRPNMRSPRRPAHGWRALTPTEVAIAHLVSAGKSNPDIATQLFLSRNTVQTHVSHILRKLRVHSRIEIARESMKASPDADVEHGGVARVEGAGGVK